jgi:FtsP/CotA-like multicopper oxidase with cupredoxin domain
MITRREAMLGAGLAGLGLAAARTARAEDAAPEARAAAAGGYRPVVTPDGESLPWKLLDGVKIYHLAAEEVEHEFAPGLSARCWGYNGRVHGPTIEAVEGDRVRIYVTNRLPAATTVHWHGVILPSGMDGVGGLSQRAIRPGETFRYEFTFRQHGTFMYHSHHDEMTQMAMGLMGMIVVHPKAPEAAPPDRDYAYMLSEWEITPGTARPDPAAFSGFNTLTLNARVFPGTAPLVVRTGERVRIRFGNLSAMDHHPIHLHGHNFRVTATDGGPVPGSAQKPETTVLVPVGATRTIEFIADNPGDWALHCHMTHHVMNQMGHGIPNMLGTDPAALNAALRPSLRGYMAMGQSGMDDMIPHLRMGHMAPPENSISMRGADGPKGYITMGGMFTILKVREELAGDGDPGWYHDPDGTQAKPATAAELRRDGIETG